VVVTNAQPAMAVTIVIADPTPTALTIESNGGGCTTVFPWALTRSHSAIRVQSR
jgi:hypothetical protein